MWGMPKFHRREHRTVELYGAIAPALARRATVAAMSGFRPGLHEPDTGDAATAVATMSAIADVTAVSAMAGVTAGTTVSAMTGTPFRPVLVPALLPTRTVAMRPVAVGVRGTARIAAFTPGNAGGPVAPLGLPTGGRNGHTRELFDVAQQPRLILVA